MLAVVAVELLSHPNSGSKLALTIVIALRRGCLNIRCGRASDGSVMGPSILGVFRDSSEYLPWWVKQLLEFFVL